MVGFVGERKGGPGGGVLCSRIDRDTAPGSRMSMSEGWSAGEVAVRCDIMVVFTEEHGQAEHGEGVE